MTINNGKALLAEHYEKHHYPAVRRRLALAFFALLATITLYAVLVINVMEGLCMFVPHY